MTSAKEANTELPGKLVNTDSAPTAQRLAVLLNGYQMDIRQAVQEVYQFELKFVGERSLQKQGGPVEVKKQEFERGPKNDVSKETRRRLIWALFQQLLDQQQEFFGRDKKIFTYDCALLLFSTNDLGMRQQQSREFVLDVNRDALEERCKAYIKNTERITAYLLRTETVSLRNAAQAFIQGDRSVVQFLELLSSQRMFDKGQHYCFGNRMYDQESAMTLKNLPHILKTGMQKNVRFVGENTQNAQPLLQLDPKKSGFFPGFDLLEFLCGLLELQPERLQQQIGHVFDRANKQVRGLVLVTTHLPGSQLTFSCSGLTNQPANEITFQREGQNISVVQHYQSTYHLNLRFPRLPCAIERRGQRDSYYPIELLKIVQGQRVPIDKQIPKLTEQMIRQCQVLPFALPEQIEEQRNAAMLQNANPFFRAHNVRIEPHLSKSEAVTLFPPAIQYNPPGDKVEPDQRGVLNWRTMGPEVPQQRQYAMPVDWPKLWAVVIVQGAVPMGQCQRFCEQLVQTARRRGIGNAELPQRVDQYEECSLEYVREKFEFYNQHRCMFVMFFAPGKQNAHPGDVHHVMKLMEQQCGVVTQHISPNIMNKGISGGGGAAMVIENILMKTNLKMGGANYNLVTPEVFKRAGRNQQDIFADIWLSGKRMFMGIGLSHAPPQSLYERQANKAPAIPTVVGMAYSIGREMLRLRGTYWFQQPRTTILRAEQMRPFVDNIKRALFTYETANECFPEHIIVFRGGASEGEFKKISCWEGQAFIEAFTEMEAARPGGFHPPAVTIVVCQRQSNYRIIPERTNRTDKAPDQNCKPGTVVDKGFMSAALTEFLLVAHKALQGTAQPVRCTVVHEFRPQSGPAARFSKQMKLEELEYITYALTFSHGICAMSTAVPGVLVSGDALALRGRNNWKMHTADGSSVQHFDIPPLGAGHEEAEFELDNQRSAYFADVSEKLDPKIPTKFWA